MPEATPIFDLPYPTKEDGPKGPEQMQVLAQAVEAALGLIMPAGTLLATARATSPSTSFLMCEGQAVSRATYATLFAAIGTKYGTGNGTTTFNLPDLRGRAPVGADGAAGRLSANDELGKSGGEEKHTLGTSEMPSHQHTPGTLFTYHPQYSPQQIIENNYNNYSPQGGFKAVAGWDNVGQLIVGATDPSGGGSPHNNMQPYQVVNYLIKV